MSKVAIIMGSISDMPVMQEAIDILKGFDIETEVDIVSAHRTPEKLFDFSKNAHERGISVIIAGAGGAVAATKTDGHCSTAVHGGCGVADCCGTFRHHQKRGSSLDQCGGGDSAERDFENCHAADAGLVVPEARGALVTCRFCCGADLAGVAGGLDHEAT